MKQLQWDKLPQQQVSKTLWNDETTLKEQEWVSKLQSDGVWKEMEEDFKAKQLVINLMGKILLDDLILTDPKSPRTAAKQKKAELKSVLDPNTKKLVGASNYHLMKQLHDRLMPPIRNHDSES